MVNDAEDGEPSGFYARTGAEDYDAIRFSAMPSAVATFYPPAGVAIVRHHGLARHTPVSAFSPSRRMDMFVLNLSGVGRVRGRVGGAPLDASLHRGYVGFVPAATPIDVEHPASHGALLVSLPAGYVDRVFAEDEPRAVGRIESHRNDRLANLLLSLEQEVRGPGLAADLVIDGLLLAIVAFIVRADPAGRREADRIHLPAQRLRRVLDLIDGALDKDIGLADMARAAGLSPFHFARVFKLATGQTPYQYLAAQRLKRAIDYLAHSDLPLAQIALACGFAGQSHFTAAFTRAMGVSPGRYRRAHRSGG